VTAAVASTLNPRRAASVRVGCAGWAVPRSAAARFPGQGSHLERYAAAFPAVEINSSFYRYHSRSTYERWARSVPPSFRFAVKLPREITHVRRLAAAPRPLRQFLEGVSGLGRKLGVLLIQVPPSLRFEQKRVEPFLRTLRATYRGGARHPSWFDVSAGQLLRTYRVTSVAADPAPAPGAEEAGGWKRLVYHRLHGSPRMYYSAYSADSLQALASRLRQEARAASVWCIFNNTAGGAAVADALGLLRRLRR
jgi:uncharacterized protein YecE (DUF72 family)